MKKNVSRIFKLIVLSGILILLYFLLIPNQYDVLKFQKRPDTKYWNLSSGSKIGYTFIKGKSDKEQYPIIYLHGGPGGRITNGVIKFFNPLAEEGHDLYFYDQVGSGHSNRLLNIEEYSVSRHQKDLAEIFKKIGSEKIILIAQSWGTMLAISHLPDYKDQIDKMIFIGAGPILPINTSLSNTLPPDSLNFIKPKFSNQQGNAKAYNIRSKLTLYYASIFGKKLASDQEADDFFTHLNTELRKSTLCDGTEAKPSEGGGGYYTHIMTVKSFSQQKDQRSQFKNSMIPTLIIKGQCDNQKWGFTKEYLDLLPNSKLEIIPNSGHIPQARDQEKYLKSIIDFLKK